MNKLLKIKKDTIITVLAFIIPALIMLLIVIIGEYAPFGKTSILLADMRYQFVDYIGYLKSVYFGNNDLFYSFSKTFGGDMSGLTAYYLNNPLYFIFLLFPNDMLPVAVVWLLVATTGLCGLTFNIMLNKIWGRRVISLIFSTAYAFTGYMMGYINCIHYFFSVIMLPLVILGLFKMVRARRISFLYVLSAAAAVISNYYIGYMILIFTAVFFLSLLFSDIEKFDNLKDRIRTCIIVLYSTLLAVGLSAFSLCAVIFSLRGQKSSGLHLALSRNFNIFEFFSGLYTGSFTGNISNGLPVIYSGAVTVVFLLLFFMNRTIAIREKIAALSLMLFMLLGFWIDALNVAWHGFAHPIGFPYRNSFLFSFLVIFFAYRGFICLRNGFRKSHANYIMAILLIYSVYLYLIHSEYGNNSAIIITIAITAMALILIVALNEKNKYIVPALFGLMVLQFSDLYINGSRSLDAYFDDKSSYENSIEAYSAYIDDTQKIVDIINENDPDFYRMEKLYRRTHNDPMMFSYNGLSHFSSCERDQAKSFLGHLGFRNNGLWAYYGSSSTAFADSLMGVRYLLSQYDETGKPYDKIFISEDNKHIYRNNYALPIGFGMSDKVMKLNMRVKDKFILQNQIAGCFMDTHFQIYRPVRIKDKELYNVIEDGTIYRRNNDGEAYIEYVLSIDSNDFMYLYFDADDVQRASLSINGDDKGEYFSTYDWSIADLGYYNPGDEVRVRLTLEDDELNINDAQFYYEKDDILKAWYNEVSATDCRIRKISSSKLTADVNMSKSSDLLVFSIPYEKDWIVKVDGKRVNTIEVMDSLMAIELSEGEHKVELRYIPRGLLIGTPISIISIITISCIFLYINKSKIQVKKRNKKIIKNFKKAVDNK